MLASNSYRTFNIKKRAAFVAVLLVIFFIFAAILANLTVVKIQSKAEQVVTLSNKQINIWDKIERAILQVPLGISPEEMDAYTADQFKQYIKTQLNEIEKIQSELFQSLSHKPNFFARLLGGTEKKELIELIQIEKPIHELIQKFTEYPVEIIVLGLYTWDSESQILFKSGKYLNPPKKLAKLARASAAENSSRVLITVVAINALLIILILAIWWFFILSGFNEITREHTIQLRIKERLIKRNSQFTAAFLSMQDPACILNSSGVIKNANTHFINSFSNGAYKLNSLNSFVMTFDNVNLRDEILDQERSEKIIAKLAEAQVIYINSKPYVCKCSRLASDEWFLVMTDQSIFYEQREKDIHNERLTTLGEISGGVAHDFNNILSTLMNRIELLETNHEPLNVIRKEQARILETCGRAKSLTSQLLSFSRKQVLKPVIISCSELAKILQSELFIPKNINFKLICNVFDYLNVDSHYFVTSVENIVKNAIESIGQDGGEILINFELEKNDPFGSYVNVVISDSGPGFSETTINKALEPFYSSKSEQHGVGLGLPMVLGFAKQSGGSLKIKNKKGHGAVVILKFPKAKASHKNTKKNVCAVPQDAIITQNNDRKTCLIIEDNREISELFFKFLQNYYSNVIIARTLSEAYIVIKETKNISTAVCDWSLPDGTSQKAIESASLKWPNIQVVIMSGYVDESINKFATKNEITVLGKPVSFSKLKTVMNLRGNVKAG